MSIFFVEKDGNKCCLFTSNKLTTKIGQEEMGMFPKRKYSLQKKLYKSFALFSKGKDAFDFFFSFLLKMLRYGLNKVQVLRIRCVTGNHTECWSLYPSLYLISISVCCSSTLYAATTLVLSHLANTFGSIFF